MRVIVFSVIFGCLLCLSGPLIKAKLSSNIVTKGMYYWETHVYLGEEQREFLKKRHIQKLYVKILDIGWNEVFHAHPLVSSKMYDKIEQNRNINIVPVIFITNESILKTPATDIDT